MRGGDERYQVRFGGRTGYARTAIKEGYVKPIKKIFDNAKVSDHFAIIPTLQAPSGLSDAEQRLMEDAIASVIARQAA